VLICQNHHQTIMKRETCSMIKLQVAQMTQIKMDIAKAKKS
jgi:hypothetical protein